MARKAKALRCLAAPGGGASHSKWKHWVGLVAFAAVCVTAPALAAPPSPQHLRDAAKKVVSQKKYQQKLPVAKPAKPTKKTSRSSYSGPSFSGLPSLGSGPAKMIAYVMLATLAAAFIALLVWVFARSRFDLPNDAKVSTDDAPVEASPQVADERFADAEALAREGRYDEAIHALLLASLAILRHRGKVVGDPALTSRELLGATTLTGASRDSLSALVAAVERSIFAGLSADPRAYEACAKHYAHLRNNG